jgi:hypothetical protein
MISTDGTGERVTEVALWIRSLLPNDPGVRIWLVDQGYNGYVELIPGMSGEISSPLGRSRRVAIRVIGPDVKVDRSAAVGGAGAEAVGIYSLRTGIDPAPASL